VSFRRRASQAWATIALIVWLVWSAGAGAAPCDAPKPIRFAAGENAAALAGGIARGEIACFTITARQGQHMIINQPAQNDTNVVMQIYRPPWTIVRLSDGLHVRGRTLPGAAEGEDANGWAGALPKTGRYLLVLGSSWGGAEYHLRVEIH
jgi:hypothetical protein